MSPRSVIAVSSDMIFRSRIGEVVTSGGARYLPVKSEEKLREALSSDGEKIVLVDLNIASLDTALIFPLIVASPLVRRLVAFVSHVDDSAITKAREAGYPEIVARSKFVQMLPGLITAE